MDGEASDCASVQMASHLLQDWVSVEALFGRPGSSSLVSSAVGTWITSTVAVEAERKLVLEHRYEYAARQRHRIVR